MAKIGFGQNWSNQDGHNGIGQSRSLPLLAPAGVAVCPTSLATTVQRVRGPGCWGRGFSVESAAARVWNVFFRDLDLPVAQHDGRRLGGCADGLPLFRGAQLAIDTTLITSVRVDGLPSRRCATEDGAALVQARRRKQRCCPELSGAHGRARLVVPGADVKGRSSEEARAFVSQLAKAKGSTRAGRACATGLPPPLVLHLALQQGLLHCLSWRSDLLWGVTATHRLRLRLLVLVATCHFILFPESSVVDIVCAD